MASFLVDSMLIRAKVDFRKPDIKALRQKGMCLVDMHFHTRYSDTYTRVSSILKRAERLGIGVAITDHNEIEGALKARKLAGDLLVVVGEEIKTRQGEILAYSVKKRIPPNRDISRDWASSGIYENSG